MNFTQKLNINHFLKRCIMPCFKPVLKCIVLVLAAAGLLLIAGCGGGVEKEKMAAFLAEYQENLDKYAEAISKADSALKSEIEAKLDASKNQWLVLKDAATQNITPQVMEKFEKEYQVVRKKYESLHDKS